MVVDRVCVGDGEVESRRAAAQKRLATKVLPSVHGRCFHIVSSTCV